LSKALAFDSFAQRLLQLLEEGRVVATYKYAVLLGLLEVLIENSGKDGRAPKTVRTRELAAAVLEIYWPHTRPFDDRETLRQNLRGQAEIVSLIARFRGRTVGDTSSPLSHARWKAPEAFDKLVRSVEWKLIEMPLGKLQLIGDQYDPFIYELDWEHLPKQSEVKSDRFDGRLLLVPQAGDHLLRSAPLLRPLVRSLWAVTVSRFNGLQQADLEEFLFGAKRISLAPVTTGIREVSGGMCFYCRRNVKTGGQVDHFVPWARHIDNGIHNLVYAHGRCNNAKGVNLAAAAHVERWLQRVADAEGALKRLATAKHWDSPAEKTVAAARSIYLGLPPNYKLWVRANKFEDAVGKRLATLFAAET
jgi:5-methylcytosine-specific restriction endonuclease McrA